MDRRKTIRVFDTTLRDGEQMPGVSLNVSDKLRIALALEKLGVDAIEAGFPASSKSDYTAVYQIASQIKNSTVVALARADKNDIDTAVSALSPAEKKRLHIFIATSDLHLSQKLCITREHALELIRETVSYGVSKGIEVEFAAEDATRSDREFLIQALTAAVESGASIINIPDTVGYTTPSEFGVLIRDIKQRVIGDRDVSISVHCHNDLGLAVANTLSAVKNGADWFDCTINGIGERAGNASLEEVVMALFTRKDTFGASTNIVTSLLCKTSHLVSSITGVYIPPNKAIVGRNAFAHQSGIHQHGILANPATYEIMTPQSVGFNESTIILGKLSGHHAFEEKLDELGIKVDGNIIKSAFEAFKNLSCRKKDVSDDDLRALVEEAVIDSHITGGYELESYQTQSGNRIKAMSMVMLSKNGKQYVDAAIGEGPIDASFNAINKMLARDYKLVFYNIKAVTGGTDALGEVRVRISDGEREYLGKGISTDIIESSIKAYINAINRADINIGEQLSN